MTGETATKSTGSSASAEAKSVTVTDIQTGDMWEKNKSNSGGSIGWHQCPVNGHCKATAK